MNRLTARGIALEASADRKRIIVLTRERDVRDAIQWMTTGGFEPEVTRISRAAGRQEVWYFSGGSVEFRDPAAGAPRGRSVDLVYVDDWPQTDRLRRELIPVVEASRSGEVVWA